VARRTAPDIARETTLVAVPRRWLIGLLALVVLPWLIAAALYGVDAGAPAGDAAPSVASGPAAAANGGPWGRLTVTPIVVSPPLEYVSVEWGSIAAPEWRFPETSLELLDAFLSSSGLTRDEVDRLRSAARPDPRIRGLVVAPDPALVRGLSAEIRARIYLQLAKVTLNFDQAHSFRFLAPSSDAWLGGSLIAPETRQLVEPLIYRDGEYLHFADLDLLRSVVGDVEELRRLAKTLLRQSTVLVRLSIGDASEIGSLAEYWGRGGRRTDIRPLLESIVAGGPERSIDVVHLLPSFARDHLYRYPKLSAADFDKPVIANCLWTALNFFNPDPDDRFLEVPVALKRLKEDYYVVEHGFQLGDIVAFLDAEGDLYHVAVYLADDLVFSKNGTSPMAPWTIMTIDRLKGYYRTRSREPRLIYHRRNDL
jgi:hypothetical protein